MQIRSVKIPLGFLITGIIWVLLNNLIIPNVTLHYTKDTGEIIRNIADFGFVLIASFVLYFQIERQQKSLIKSTEKYRSLFENNPNPMWIFNTETFRFVKVNYAAVEQYGYSMKEFLSMSTMDIRPESEREHFRTTVKALTSGVRKNGTWKHLKKNGELVYVTIVSYDLEFNGQACCLSMLNNITEIILNDEKIKAQNALLQEIAWSNSHEIRHGVCSIIGLIALLKETSAEEEKNEYIRMLEKCTEDLDSVLMRTNNRVDDVSIEHSRYVS